MGPGLGIDYSQRGVSIRHFALDADATLVASYQAYISSLTGIVKLSDVTKSYP